jgi:hypothetical protein
LDGVDRTARCPYRLDFGTIVRRDADLVDLYPWLVFTHIAGAFVFVLAHGVSAWASLQIDREHEPARIRALLELMSSSLAGAYVGLLLLLVAGIWAGISGGHFGRGWIWAALGLLIVIAVVMYAIGTRYYGTLRTAVGLRTMQTPKDAPDPVAVGQAELDAILARSPSRALAGIGYGGLGLILLLMVLKPF